MHTITQAQRQRRIPVLTAAAGGCGDVPTDRAAGVVRRPSTKLTARPTCRGVLSSSLPAPAVFTPLLPTPHTPCNPGRPVHTTPQNTPKHHPRHTHPPPIPHPPAPRSPSPYSTPVVTGPEGDVRSLLDYLLKDFRSLLDYLLKDVRSLLDYLLKDVRSLLDYLLKDVRSLLDYLLKDAQRSC